MQRLLLYRREHSRLGRATPPVHGRQCRLQQNLPGRPDLFTGLFGCFWRGEVLCAERRLLLFGWPDSAGGADYCHVSLPVRATEHESFQGIRPDPGIHRRLLGGAPPYYAGGSDYTAINCYCCGLANFYDSMVPPACPQGVGSFCGGRLCPPNGRAQLAILESGHSANFDRTDRRRNIHNDLLRELAGRPDLWVRGKKLIAKCPCQGGNLQLVNANDPDLSAGQRRRMLGMPGQCLQPDVWLDVYGRHGSEWKHGAGVHHQLHQSSQDEFVQFPPGNAAVF